MSLSWVSQKGLGWESLSAGETPSLPQGVKHRFTDRGLSGGERSAGALKHVSGGAEERVSERRVGTFLSLLLGVQYNGIRYSSV